MKDLKIINTLNTLNRLVKKDGLFVVAIFIVDSPYGKIAKENNIFRNLVHIWSTLAKCYDTAFGIRWI